MHQEFYHVYTSLRPPFIPLVGPGLKLLKILATLLRSRLSTFLDTA